jgi:hypothetical protein
MFYTELFFATKVWGWIFRQIGCVILGLLAIAGCAMEGIWWPAIALGAIVLACWALGRGIKWLIARNEPPQYTVEQLAAHSRLISEMAQGNIWFDPSKVPMPPAATVTPVRRVRVEPTISRRW